jgi:hypothetical protein
LQFLSKKYPIFFTCKFFSIFGHQNPGFGTGSGSAIKKNAGTGFGYALYQCGSTSLAQQPLLEQSVQPALAGFHHKTNHGPLPLSSC